jgi:hypothetical protein
MICYIHRDSRFEKHLGALRERGGTALSAVKKAEEIINRILAKGRENSLKVGKLTRKGELRIKSGIKFDLGNGYRLVCAKKGPHLTLLFIGTHDDCSRWLERNKGLQYDIEDSGDNMIVTRKVVSRDFEPTMMIDPTEEYEKQLMKRIDDKVLRNIFCGLVDK